VGRLETPATCIHTQRDSSVVYLTSWLRFIPFLYQANYIFLRTSHFFSLSSSSPIPHNQIRHTQTPQPGNSGSELSRSNGASSNTSLIGTQQECRHQLVHHEAANAATKYMTKDAHLKIVHKTRSCKDKQQHEVECRYIYIVLNG